MHLCTYICITCSRPKCYILYASVHIITINFITERQHNPHPPSKYVDVSTVPKNKYLNNRYWHIDEDSPEDTLRLPPRNSLKSRSSRTPFDDSCTQTEVKSVHVGFNNLTLQRLSNSGSHRSTRPSKEPRFARHSNVYRR